MIIDLVVDAQSCQGCSGCLHGRAGMRLQLLEEGILQMVATVLQIHKDSSAAAQGNILPTDVNIVEITAQIISTLSADPMFKTFISTPRLLTTLVCLAAPEQSIAARVLLLCCRPYFKRVFPHALVCTLAGGRNEARQSVYCAC